MKPILLRVVLRCHQLNDDQIHSYNALNSSSGVSFSVTSTMLGLQERDGAGDDSGDCCLMFLHCLFEAGVFFLAVKGHLLAISEALVARLVYPV